MATQAKVKTARPISHELVDLLGDAGLGEEEIDAIKVILNFVAKTEGEDALRKANEEIAALKSDYSLLKFRETRYLNALIGISGMRGDASCIASEALYGEPDGRDVIAIRVEVSPLGNNGLLKLTAPDMPKFSIVGKTIEELYANAPMCIAEMVNWAQMTDRERESVLAGAGIGDENG